MSRKRELIAKFLPNGLPFGDVLSDNARFVKTRRERFSDCPEFPERSDLYRHLANGLEYRPITYLEFGVWKGASIDAWRALNSHPDSTFTGFDTFEGLPEDWDVNHPKGTFSTDGNVPEIDDPRVSFHKGLFQKTLKPFLRTNSPQHRLIVNVDCDIYSATLFVLGTLDKYFEPGTIIIFDDFYSMSDEFKAFFDYDRSFGRSWNALGRNPFCTRAAIEIAV